MRTLMAAVAALTVAMLVTAATPTVTVKKLGNVSEVRLQGTTNAPDTCFIPTWDWDWNNGINNSCSIDLSLFGNHTAGDSVSVVLAPGFRKATTGWINDQFFVGSTAISPVVNGQAMAAATGSIATVAPYFRVVVSDGDVTTANMTYDVYIYYANRKGN